MDYKLMNKDNEYYVLYVEGIELDEFLTILQFINKINNRLILKNVSYRTSDRAGTVRYENTMKSSDLLVFIRAIMEAFNATCIKLVGDFNAGV